MKEKKYKKTNKLIDFFIRIKIFIKNYYKKNKKNYLYMCFSIKILQKSLLKMVFFINQQNIKNYCLL
jgi:hypothetical protein